jgi:thymidine kinase
MKNKAGELTLIVGGMFSGKSTEAQRHGKRHELAGRRVDYFKPKTDDRYEKDSISTHDGSHVKAKVISKSSEILFSIADVVVIDEVQFFDRDVVKIIDLLLMKGVHVIAAGLDLDRFGEPFGMVPDLLAKAENVTKLKAVCQSCGDDAWVSAGSFESDQIVEVGEKDKYVPLCRTCYYHKGGIL